MKVFVIGDTHFPYHDKRSLKRILSEIKKEKPDAIVQIGDLLDQYVFSKYPRSTKISVSHDIRKGLRYATEFWKAVRKAAPKAKCYQILGNHDLRMAKRISEKLPELGEIFTHKDLYKFEGVKVMKSDRDYLELDGVVYVHGYLSKSIDHAKHFNKPVVHGHRHRPCIEVEGKLWSMDVGFVADEKQLPLQYTQTKLTKWKKAYGIVENKQPILKFL